MIEQGTPEWYQARLGKITASRVADVMDRTAKGQPGAKRTAYMRSLLAERLTGQMVENYVNMAMEHGIETEPAAVDAYERATAQFVEQAGFVLHPQYDFVGGVQAFIYFQISPAPPGYELGAFRIAATKVRPVKSTLRTPQGHKGMDYINLVREPSHKLTDALPLAVRRSRNLIPGDAILFHPGFNRYPVSTR